MPRPAQQSRRWTGPTVQGERAGANEAAAQGGRGNQGHGNVLPDSQAACRLMLYSGSGERAASRLARVRQYASDTAAGAMLSASMPSMRSSTARTKFWPTGVQQQARARLHARDALHGIERRGGLHHHELPADRVP